MPSFCKRCGHIEMTLLLCVFLLLVYFFFILLLPILISDLSFSCTDEPWLSFRLLFKYTYPFRPLVNLTTQMLRPFRSWIFLTIGIASCDV